MPVGISHSHGLHIVFDTHIFETDNFRSNNILGTGCTPCSTTIKVLRMIAPNPASPDNTWELGQK